MGYSIDPITDDCYPNTTVLINKYDVRDEKKLQEIELAVVSSSAMDWEASPKDTRYNFEHYKHIHRYLFSELYEWAGEIRKVNISKKGTRFCLAENIEERAKLIFDRLAENNLFKNLEFDDFVEQITDFYCVLNDLHPFREGNGRTQRVFMTQLIEENGYQIDFYGIDSDLLMFATINAAHGVRDQLREIFKNNIV